MHLCVCMYVVICLCLGRLQSEQDDIRPLSFLKLAFLLVDINYRKAKVYIGLKFMFIIKPLKDG